MRVKGLVIVLLLGILAWLLAPLAGEGTRRESPALAGGPAQPAGAQLETAAEEPAPAVAREPAVPEEPAAEPREDEAPLAGRLVSDLTETPLGGVEITVKRRARKASTVTGPDGRFEVDPRIGPGELSFTAKLDGVRVSLATDELEVDGTAPFELRARIGPLYLVDLVGPPEAQEARWTARLVRRQGAGDLPVSVERPLEGGRPRAVRFPEPPRRSAEGDAHPHLLVLTDEAGEWYGEAVPPALEGEPREVVQVAVARRGALTGRVVEAEEQPLAGATVHVTRARGEPWPPIAGPWKLARTDAGGRFRIEPLEPGDYHVMVAPPFRPMVHREVYVPGAGHDLGTIAVAGGGELGAVSGVLRSASGTTGLAVLLQLEALDGSGWARSTIVGKPTPLFHLFYGVEAVSRGGTESELAFSIDKVPSGRHRLVVVPWDGYRYEPAELEVTAPDSGIEILRLDAGETFGFGFEVVDAESGEPIEEFLARFHTALWGKEKSYPRRSGEILGRIPVGGDLAWEVFAPGYVPVRGDASSFNASGDPRFARVELARGWGAELTVRDGRDPRRHFHRSAAALSLPAPGAVPLAGVRVLADGEEVGVTDADGRCTVALEGAPERLDFERFGWVVTPSTTFADGAVLLDCPSPEVWMVPGR